MNERKIYDNANFEIFEYQGKHGLLLVKFPVGTLDPHFPITEVYLVKDGSYFGKIYHTSAQNKTNHDFIYGADTTRTNLPIGFFINEKVKIPYGPDSLQDTVFTDPIDFLVERSEPIPLSRQK
jgi:hypothetical protein